MTQLIERSANYFNDQDVFSDDLNFTEAAGRYKRQEGITTLLNSWGVAAASNSTDLQVTVGADTFSVTPGRAIDSYGRIINVPGSIAYPGTSTGVGADGDDDYRPTGTLPATDSIPLSDSLPTYINIAYTYTSGSTEYDDDGVGFHTRHYDSYVISQEAAPGTGAKVPLAQILGDKTVVDSRKFATCWSGASSLSTMDEHLQRMHTSGLVGATFNAAIDGSLGVTQSPGGSQVTINRIVSGDLLFLNGLRYAAVVGAATAITVFGIEGYTFYVWVEGSDTAATITWGNYATAPTWTVNQYPVCSGVLVASGDGFIITPGTLTDLRKYLGTTTDNIRDVSAVATGTASTPNTVTTALNTLKIADATTTAGYQAADTVLQANIVASYTNIAGTEISAPNVNDAQYWKVCTLPATSDLTYDKVVVELTGGTYASTDLGYDKAVFSNRDSFGYSNSQIKRSADARTTLRIIALRDGAAGTAVGIYIHKPAGIAWAKGIAKAYGINVGGTYTALPIGAPTTVPTEESTSLIFDSGNTVSYPLLAGDGWSMERFNTSSGHTHSGTSTNGPQILAAGLASMAVTDAKRMSRYGVHSNIAVSAPTNGILATFTGTGTNPALYIDTSGVYIVLIGATVACYNTASTLSVETWVAGRAYEGWAARAPIVTGTGTYDTCTLSGILTVNGLETTDIRLMNRGASLVTVVTTYGGYQLCNSFWYVVLGRIS